MKVRKYRVHLLQTQTYYVKCNAVHSGIDEIRRHLKKCGSDTANLVIEWVPGDYAGESPDLVETHKQEIKMSKENKQALEECILHWKENLIAASEGNLKLRMIFSDHCALCALHIDIKCSSCPVRLRTGVIGCGRTPWVEVYNLLKFPTISMEDAYARATLEHYVQEEISFLEMLLEEEEG